MEEVERRSDLGLFEGLIVEKLMRINGCISLEGVFMELVDSLCT
jgi:hypothetical protein